jgi:hypothetical protein
LDVIKDVISKPLDMTMWFDGVLDLVQVRDKALDEVCEYLDKFAFEPGSPEHMKHDAENRSTFL